MRDMPFVKLDCGMLMSTIWVDLDARIVFITALLMAEPAEYPEPVPQIHVNSLNYTGWSAPPGWYGYVPAAGPGIVRMAGLKDAEGMAALERLGDPDLGSRSQEYDGRRLIRIDGGYLVLNYIRYREKDATTAERSKRWRERKKIAESVTTRVLPCPTRVTRHQVDAEVDSEVEVEADSKAGKSKPLAPRKSSARWRRVPEAERVQTEEQKAYAVKYGIDPVFEWERFTDYEFARTLTDVTAAWRNWVKGALERQRPARPVSVPSQPTQLPPGSPKLNARELHERENHPARLRDCKQGECSTGKQNVYS